VIYKYLQIIHPPVEKTCFKSYKKNQILHVKKIK